MIIIPRNKVAVVPIYDAKVSRGGIIKPSSYDYKRTVQRFDVYGSKHFGDEPRKLDECESKERANYLIGQYENKGYIQLHYKIRREDQQVDTLDAGERCDQGIVKYIGREVKDIKIGDYVFFSGYTGTLANVEGEGKLIILPEDFIEFKLGDEPQTEIPGLYFKDKDGHFFNVTYESVMEIIAETFTLIGKTYNVNSPNPKLEDYNVR